MFLFTDVKCPSCDKFRIFLEKKAKSSKEKITMRHGSAYFQNESLDNSMSIRVKLY